MKPKTILAVCLIIFPSVLLAQLPAGSIALYPLNNSINDISGNGYNGTLTSTFSAANRFATAGSATGFTAGTSTGTLPGTLVTAMQDDFTIGYWFNTTMVAPNSSQWYGGTALVDAEVCGGTTDWGTALINGGAVAFGIGNPDMTVVSTATNYNDGNWHFVTATRAEVAGTIILYVDGVQVATTSGTATTARTAPSLIGLGRNVCVAAGVYTGNLDDVIAYARVLTPAEVTNLFNYYNSIALPLTLESFTGQARDGTAVLQWRAGDVSGNDYFEIDRSKNGNNFVEIGQVSNGSETVANPGAFTYQFADLTPLGGSNYYRIKQVDLNGHYSWSPVVEVTIGAPTGGFHLETNPVTSTITLANTGQEFVQRLQVVDVSGRVIFGQMANTANSLITASVQQLQPGYYFLRCSSDKGTETIPFVKLP